MTTKCQIRISTPAGVGNSFHAAYTNRVKGGIEFMEIHWSEHPEYAAGLYSNKGGKIEIIDQQWHDEHPEYKCRMDETYSDPGARWEFLRSPWFDSQCDASDSTHQIAQELQLSFLGSGSPFFSPEKLSSVAADCILDPMHVGTLTQWVRKVKFYDSDPRSNRCKLWFDPVSGRPLQNTTYTIGIDVSAGTGASDSCISVADDTASEKVFGWVSNGVTPEQLAVVADAVGDWFTTEKGKPYIAWDAGGPGAAFGIVLMRLGSHHVYYHTPSGVVNAKRASKPGVPSQASLKQELMETYRAALFSGSFITRSRAAFEQCEQFKYSEGGQRIVHQKSVNSRDSSGRGEQHGDIASSEAVLVLAMRDRPAPRRSAVVVRQGCPQWFKDNLRREKSRASSSFVGHAFYG